MLYHETTNTRKKIKQAVRDIVLSWRNFQENFNWLNKLETSVLLAALVVLPLTV